MTGFRQLKVVELDEGCDGFLHCGQLYQSHLPVFGEKLKCLKKEEYQCSKIEYSNSPTWTVRLMASKAFFRSSSSMEEGMFDRWRVADGG